MTDPRHGRVDDVACERAELGPGQLAHWQSHGWLHVGGVFDAAELAVLRRAAEDARLEHELCARGIDQSTVHIMELALKQPAFLQLALDSRVCLRVAALIGPDVQLQHSKLCVKARALGHGEFPWHQDFSLNPHSNYDLLTVLVWLDPASDADGAIRFVRGSHRFGQLNHLVDGQHALACQEPLPLNGRGTAGAVVDVVTVEAGDITLHHCLTLHASGATQTGRPRRAAGFYYRADDAYQFSNRVWRDTGILVRGAHCGRVRCVDAVFPLLAGGRKKSFDGEYQSAYAQLGPYGAGLTQPAQPAQLVTERPDT